MIDKQINIRNKYQLDFNIYTIFYCLKIAYLVN